MRRARVTRSSAVAVAGVTALIAGLVPTAQAAPSTTATHRTPASTVSLHPKLGPGGRVIVLLRDYTTGFSARTADERVQARAARSDISSLAGRIHRAGGSVSHQYTLINGLSATVSQREADSLAADPAVQEVVPDEPIRATPVTSAETVASQPPTAPVPGACAANGGTQLEPQALEATRADSDVPGAATARSLGYTGKGVTVAWIADGLNIDNPDFIRDGKSIFTDYQDFSGDGVNSPTGGDEAFLDASAIAAQGNQTYDISNFSALPLSTACKIRIEGEAPGVNLVGLNIFGNEDAGYNSSFIQAIQYATVVDHVNVLNESLGSNLYPDDSGSLDAVKAANDAAVARGVTVTASSGDAGVTSTIGTPAGDPNVISVGASTTYRFYLQTGYGGARLPGITGWRDDNISSLSSGGYTESGRTVDLVAPGDLNWALCTADAKQYSECTDFKGNPSDIEESGGTSESAPVTAGIAALVIEAYRDGHNGATPSPAVVKDILVSTADDIQAPAQQQGAGLVDAYKAVQLARSYRSSTRTGHTISVSSTQFTAASAGSSLQRFRETVTNQGTSTQRIRVGGRALGSYSTLRTAAVTLSDANSPKYVDFQGITDNYEKVTFTVPRGENRLSASIAFRNASATDLAARVRMDLVDPTGHLASYSLPQGDGNYGHGEVANPQAGTWTAYIESRISSKGGTQGRVVFAAQAAKWTRFGLVSPSVLTLAPGRSGTVTLTDRTPAEPGDVAGALVLTTGTSDAGVPATTTVPVLVRTLIPTGRHTFADTLTGGNGREVITGQTFYYGIDVARKTPELNANVLLGHDARNSFFAYLIAPNGNAQASAANEMLTTYGGGLVPAGKPVLGAQLHVISPQAGRWTLIVLFAPQVSGTAISQRFTVETDQTPVPVSASRLPNSTRQKIKSGTTRTVYVTVRNTGRSPEAFFVDARLLTTAVGALQPVTSPVASAPLHAGANVPYYLVPTRTTAIAAVAGTDGPTDIQFDMGAPAGDPDILSGVGKTVGAAYADKAGVSQGVWDVAPTEIGPFQAAGTKESVDTAMVAKYRKFDPEVHAATGDLWLSAVDPGATLNTITVGPGLTASIPVRIHVTGKPRTVHGTLFVDDADLFNVAGVASPNGNEVAALPYTFRVVK